MNTRLIPCFAAAAILLGGCSFENEMTIRSSEISGLTEDRAIELTRSALQHANLVADGIRPVPFQPASAKLFASNSLDPDTGYVLWKNTVKDSGAVWDFIVTIRKKGDLAVITISEGK